MTLKDPIFGRDQRHSKTRCLGETSDTQRPNIWARPTTLKDPMFGRDQRHSKTQYLGETNDTQRPNIWARPTTLKDQMSGRDQRHSKTRCLGETSDSRPRSPVLSRVPLAVVSVSFIYLFIRTLSRLLRETVSYTVFNARNIFLHIYITSGSSCCRFEPWVGRSLHVAPVHLVCTFSSHYTTTTKLPSHWNRANAPGHCIFSSPLLFFFPL